MKRTIYGYPSSYLSCGVGIMGAAVGVILGILAGLKPLWLCLAIASIILVICFFTFFEQTVLGLLILRSSLDIFSAQQVPAIFAVGLDALTILYVVLMLLLGRKVVTDKFFWFFAVWVGIQGLWILLMPIGGLGLGASYLLVSLREWIRIFSWLMIYLLVTQLRELVHPLKVVNTLFCSLIAPLSAAILQIIVPSSMLPSFLAPKGSTMSDIDGAVRINGTFGHPNAFVTFLVFFIGLTLWQLWRSHNKPPWLLLLAILVFFITSTKTLVALGMVGVLGFAIVLPKLDIPKLLGTFLLFSVLIGLFASTEFGRERLISMMNTPIFNPDIDTYTAIMLRRFDGNSFLWRIEQWTYLLEAWKSSLIFGFGLDTSRYLTHLNNSPHNDYIRALVEGGILGLLAFIGWLVTNLFRLARLYLTFPEGSLQKSLCLVLSAILLAMIFGMMTENVWSHTTMWSYWLTLIAVTGWNWNKAHSSN